MNTTTKLALVALTAALLAVPTGVAFTTMDPEPPTVDAPLVDILSDEPCDVGGGNGQGAQRANENACD